MVNRPTIIDVAKIAGVSKTTVSRVINDDVRKVSDETVKRVRQAIEELGYQHNSIASSLRTDRTNIIMLMIPDITNPFWPEVARGIQDRMDEAGYSVVFANLDWNHAREQDFLKIAMQTRVDGILINPIHVSEKQIITTQIPSVVLGIRPGFNTLDMVGSDSPAAMREALAYLVRLGHERIALLLGSSETGSSHSRKNNFLNFFAERDLPVQSEFVVNVRFDNHGGEEGMTQLLQMPEKPTAVIASNDLIALGALQVANSMGYQVPKDISIMGIDDIYAASLSIPALSTVRKDKYQIGKIAANYLIQRMTAAVEQGKQQISKVPCQLVVRGSTTRPA
ncbi:MAG: LacI family DNA-binding transcriptional regulator [Anaerolineaceae bacterium]|nr:LacI family DNA-binding transcriptional regulator [Anaerolineaceae bacterium]